MGSVHLPFQTVVVALAITSRHKVLNFCNIQTVNLNYLPLSWQGWAHSNEMLDWSSKLQLFKSIDGNRLNETEAAVVTADCKCVVQAPSRWRKVWLLRWNACNISYCNPTSQSKICLSVDSKHCKFSRITRYFCTLLIDMSKLSVLEHVHCYVEIRQERPWDCVPDGMNITIWNCKDAFRWISALHISFCLQL